MGKFNQIRKKFCYEKILLISLFIRLEIYAQTPKMQDVVPASENSIGIDGLLKNTNPSSSTLAIIGINLSTNSNGYGIYGAHSGSGIGVYGYSNSGRGGQFNSSTGFAVETSGKLRFGGSGVGTLDASSSDFLYFLKL